MRTLAILVMLTVTAMVAAVLLGAPDDGRPLSGSVVALGTLPDARTVDPRDGPVSVIRSRPPRRISARAESVFTADVHRIYFRLESRAEGALALRELFRNRSGVRAALDRLGYQQAHIETGWIGHEVQIEGRRRTRGVYGATLRITFLGEVNALRLFADPALARFGHVVKTRYWLEDPDAAIAAARRAALERAREMARLQGVEDWTERSVSYVDPAIRRPMSVQDRRIRLSAEATLVLAPPIETVIRETHQ